MGNSNFNTTQNKKTVHRNGGNINDNHEKDQFTATGYFRHFNKMKTRGRQRQHNNCSPNYNDRYTLNRQNKNTNESLFSKKELPIRFKNVGERN